MRAYDDLVVRFRHRAAIEEAAGMLHWDTATLMPSGGAEARGEQLAALNKQPIEPAERQQDQPRLCAAVPNLVYPSVGGAQDDYPSLNCMRYKDA